ncbi:RNA polymerase sigma factor [Sphingomonas sp.]|uniref:RNA polymerase sigma factor n=1 Tax=Sphingomonas sp. TaxID=28214 RepID=UPI003B3BB027
MNQLSEMLRRVRLTLRRRGVADQDTEDLVQEAFLKVERYEQRQAVRSQEALLMSTAVNLSIDEARRNARAPFGSAANLSAIADHAPDPEQVLRARQRLVQASAGLEKLPDRTRRILLRRRLDGVSYAVIAQEEGMSVPAVEKQVARATLEMMKWMEQW